MTTDDAQSLAAIVNRLNALAMAIAPRLAITPAEMALLQRLIRMAEPQGPNVLSGLEQHDQD